MSDIILRRKKDGRYFSNFDAGCPCWVRHIKDAKRIDPINDDLVLYVLAWYADFNRVLVDESGNIIAQNGNTQ